MQCWEARPAPHSRGRASTPRKRDLDRCAGEAPHVWGLPRAELTEREWQRVEEANTLIINLLTLCEGVSSRGGVHLLEHPRDPEEEPFPSIWDSGLVRGFEARTGAVRCLLDQCMYGGPTQKGTCISGTADGLCWGARLCDRSHSHESSIGKVGGRFLTQRLASYPPALCRFLAECVLLSLRRMHRAGTGPTGFLRTGGKSTRVSAWSTEPGPRTNMALEVLNETVANGRQAEIVGQRVGLYVHVDDGVTMAQDAAAADTAMNLAADALEKKGFKVTDRRCCGQVDKIVGYVPERSPARLRLPSRKAAVLREALMFMVSAESVCIESLRSIVGMWIWGALLARPWLAALQTVFQFMTEKAGQRARWWKAARLEVRLMAFAVPGLYADLGSPLFQGILATDAEGENDYDAGGYGVVVARAPPEVVLRAWLAGTRPRRTATRGGVRPKQLDQEDRQLACNVPLSTLPDSVWAEAGPWQPVAHGRWSERDHITLGEARAVLRALEPIAADAKLHRRRLTSMEDNMACAGAFEKGRSSSGPLNFLLRRRAALCAAAELQIALPWVETSRMTADGLSRCR